MSSTLSSTSGANASGRDFYDLVKAIGESKSKQEEDRIVADEAIAQSGTSKKKMKELVVRSLYVEMLGQDASFAYIRAVELCASTHIMQKRAGYLAASLCLSPDHEFRFMLVNQIQRDMKSSNFLEVCGALSAVCKIVTEDMIPAVVGDVVKLFKHEMDIIRKKSLCAMHRLYQMDKRSVTDHVLKIRNALCDKDPSVMGATLPLLQAMVIDSPASFKDLVPSFVSILKQITDHRLPRDFDYHRIPSPWIQMNLLKILAILGRGDQSSSEGMYEVLAEVMRRADTGINVGYAIVYEVVITVTTIYPNTVLLDAAATSISRFIRSDSHNLKYIGIKGLTAIVKDHPRYAADHQMAVIDCLEDPDETLKRKTLDLLFQMTNAVNVEFIVDKLLSFLAGATDDHFRTDLVGQITQCAERFAPSNAWYVQTVIRVFELAGDKVKPAVAHTLTQLIAEGSDSEGGNDEVDEDAVSDDELRTSAVENFLLLVGRPTLPEILAQAVAWILGEYGYLSTSSSKEEIMYKLLTLFIQSTFDNTKAQVISALMKLVAQNGSCPQRIASVVSNFRQSQALDVQQRCIEFQALLRHPHVMVEVLPVDASCEDLEVDEQLAFLQGFVQAAFLQGAKGYEVPAHLLGEEGDDGHAKRSTLKVTPYEMPSIPQAVSAASIQLAAAAGVGGVPGVLGTPSPLPLALGVSSGLAGGVGGGGVVGGQQLAANSSAAQGNQLIGTRGVAQVWGKKVEPPPPTPPPPVPSPSTPSSSSSSSSSSYPVGSSSSSAGNHSTGTAAVSNGQTGPAQVTHDASKPKVLTEKEKMAAALFGGLSGSSKPQSSSSSSSSSGASASGGVNAAGRKKAVVAQGLLVTPGPTAWGGAGSNGGSNDLNLPISGGSSASASPQPTTQSAVQSPFALLDSAVVGSTGSVASPPSLSNHTLLDVNSLLDTSDYPAPPALASPVFATLAVNPPPAVTSPQNNIHFNSNHNGITGNVMSSNSTTAHVAPTASNTMGVNGSHSISDAFSDMLLSTPSSSSFQTSSTTDDSHSIRPLDIKTAEFGRRWGSNPAEAKRSASSALTTLDQLRASMPPRYQHIESIANTQEAIFAATHTSVGCAILVHVKLAPTRRAVDVTVKSTAADLSSREVAAICHSLAAASPSAFSFH